MTEISSYLFLAGGLPFFVLGLAHARATPLRQTDRKGLSPADPAVSEAMARTRPLFTKQTDIWRGWVSFNLSHSLGAVLFAAFVFLIGRNDAAFEQNAVPALTLAIATSATYLWLAVNYWFRIPIVGCAMSCACFVLSAAARLL